MLFYDKLKPNTVDFILFEFLQNWDTIFKSGVLLKVLLIKSSILLACLIPVKPWKYFYYIKRWVSFFCCSPIQIHFFLRAHWLKILSLCFYTYRSILCKIFQMSYNILYMHVYFIHINKPSLGFSVQHFRIRKNRKVLKKGDRKDMTMKIAKRMEYASWCVSHLFCLKIL